MTKYHKELEIAFIQQEFKSKLLKGEFPNVEILFYNSSEVAIENVNENLTPENAINIGSSSVMQKTINEDPQNGDHKDDSYIDQNIKNNMQPNTKSELFDYPDLEAEYSCEENGEESKDQVLSDMIDNTADDRIKSVHFVKEREKNDVVMLKKLKYEIMMMKCVKMYKILS